MKQSKKESLVDYLMVNIGGGEYMDKLIQEQVDNIPEDTEGKEWKNSHSNKKIEGLWTSKTIRNDVKASIAIMGTFDLEWGVGFNRSIRLIKPEVRELYKFLRDNKDKF